MCAQRSHKRADGNNRMRVITGGVRQAPLCVVIEAEMPALLGEVG